MKSLQAFDEPLTVQVTEGEVVITGPGSVAVSLTPSAAAESAKVLARAAEQALRPRQASHTSASED